MNWQFVLVKISYAMAEQNNPDNKCPFYSLKLADDQVTLC